MPARPSSNRSDTTTDTPPLSPSSATRSSVASSNSSFSLGELSSRMSQMRIGSRVAHEPTECVDPQGSSRKFVHDSAMYSGVRDGDIQEELDADSPRSSRSMDRGRSHELHREGPERTSRARPSMPRQGSYSKRHSSFDTPREVPFPYGYLSHSNVPLPDHPDPPVDTRNEHPRSVPLHPPDGSGTGINPGGMVNGDQPFSPTNSADSSPNGDSSPPHPPNLERSSTTSLPLPTSTSYRALPPIFSSASTQHPDVVQAPPTIPPSSLITTGPGFSSPLVSPPRSSSLNPPKPRCELSSPSCSNQSPPSLPESPPFMADEPDMNEPSRSTDPHPPSQQDARPHHSLPPPPKFLSSLSSTSPAFRPMSLPQSVGTPSPASSSLSGSSPFPPPEPPTILTPPPPLSDAEARERKPAPYEPFLPRDQPPPDHTYIAVETVPGEYRLIVRLPGFQRDSITLAMRRRRILHVVADNWSDGGGHFERRISFGYDADLASVRAEFDGEILRVIVPRREPPGWFTQSTN